MPRALGMRVVQRVANEEDGVKVASTPASSSS